jgi:predicted nucleic acid-binding protein
MTAPILDSTVIIHLLRRYPPAISWFDASQKFSISVITWMEVMIGVTSKRNMIETRHFLSGFDLHLLTYDDQQWAQSQIERLRFSHHIDMEDCMVASVAYRLQTPLYTHNLKDMIPLIGKLAIKPYV